MNIRGHRRSRTAVSATIAMRSGRGSAVELCGQMSLIAQAQIIIKICRWVKNSPELS